MSLKTYFGRLFNFGSKDGMSVEEYNNALIKQALGTSAQPAADQGVNLGILTEDQRKLIAPVWDADTKALENAKKLANQKSLIDRRREILEAHQRRHSAAVSQLKAVNDSVEEALVSLAETEILYDEGKGDLLAEVQKENNRRQAMTPSAIKARALDRIKAKKEAVAASTSSTSSTSSISSTSSTSSTSSKKTVEKKTSKKEEKSLSDLLVEVGLTKTQAAYVLKTDLAKLESDLRKADPEKRTRIHENAVLVRPLACNHAEIAHWKEVGSILKAIAKEGAAAAAAAEAEATPEVAADGIVDATKRERLNPPTGKLIVSEPVNKTSQTQTSES